MDVTRRAMLLGMVGSAVAPACLANAQLRVEGGFAFGSSWRITTSAQYDLAKIRREIDAIIARVDQEMSPYRGDSDLTRFNRSTSPDWQRMPANLCHVTSQALHIAKLTDGAFDPTVGPLVARHGFGPISGAPGR